MVEAKAPGGKKKGTTVPLTTFLRPETSDWADEDPDSELAPLPTAPGRGTGPRGYAQPQSPGFVASDLPTEPPFKAFIANLTHGIDTTEIVQFFEPRLQVISVQILRHNDTQKIKGAFVELSSREDLVKALQTNGEFLQGRPLRVNVATGRRGPDSFRDDRRGGYGDRRPGDFDDRSRGYDDRRQGYGDRRGREFDRDSFDRDAFDRPRRGDRLGGPEPYRSAEEESSTWGHQNFVPNSPRKPQAAPPAAPVQAPIPGLAPRKKLNLAPRTIKAGEEAPQPAPASDKPSKPNPFGSARPVDGDAALKRLEEKIAKEKAEQREAEQRVREQEKERAQKEQEARQSEANTDQQARPPTGDNNRPPMGNVPMQPPPNLGQPSDRPNGEFTAPPGYGRGAGDRGRGMGRGRARGRGRGDYGRGRGQEYRGPEFSNIIRNPHNSQQPGGHGFQEAGERKQPRNRGWEGRPPSSAQPQTQVAPPAALTKVPAQAQPTDESATAKTANMFDMLTTDD